MKFNTLLTGPLLAAAVLALAAPAWAHDEISPATIPIGRPVFLTLASANERSANLTSVTLTAPGGVSLGPATRQPPGWTAQRSDTSITWTGGAVAPDNFEQWGFEIEGVRQPGPLEWSVATGYADGTSDTHQAEVVAVAPGTEPAPPAAQSAPPPSTAVSAGASTVPAAAAKTSDDDADDLATASLVVGIVAGVLAVVAIVVAARGRRRPTPPAAPIMSAGTTSSGGDAAGEEGQDW